MSWLNEPCPPVENTEFPKVSRVELIVNGQRDQVIYFEPGQTFLSLQDDGRTIKLFVTKEESGLT